MRPRFRSPSLVPTGFIVDHPDVGAERIGLVVRSGAAVTARPDCRTPSRRIRSRYRRRATDLPLGGRRVEFQVVVRRFRCDAAICERKIFAERFPDGVLPAFARRTSRLEQIVHHLGLAPGGRPGAGPAQRLMLPVGRDTLLRVIRRRATTRSDPLGVVGIDDFTAAAESLGSAQSSVSQQVARLEMQLGRRLFARTTRRVEPTPEGRALQTYARSILSVAEETRRHFEHPPIDGVLRLGIVEDFALGRLHAVLALFRRQYPRFALSLTTGLSTRLLRGLDEGQLDLVLAKRLPGRSQGRRLLSRPLVWCGDAGLIDPDPQRSVPIVTYVEPSTMRALIVGALSTAGRRFSIVAESGGLAGIHAAVTAGFGVTAFAEGFIPFEIARLPERCGLPAPGPVEYVIDQRPEPRLDAIDAFAAVLSATAVALFSG